MFAQLKNENSLVVPKLEIARSLAARTKGLLGRSELAEDHGLLILRCNSIHTFFMRFAIDLVFVNRKFVVVKVYHSVAPNRLIFPVWNASHVIELPAGFLSQKAVRIGEKLNVDPALS